LLVGKRVSATDHAYHAWIKANKLDVIPRKSRKDALWFASHLKALGDIPDGIASPASIREWARKRNAATRARAPTQTPEDIGLQAAADALGEATTELARCARALRSATQTVEYAERELKDVLRLRAHEKRKSSLSDYD
jgi:hypothetical protein